MYPWSYSKDAEAKDKVELVCLIVIITKLSIIITIKTLQMISFTSVAQRCSKSS